MEDLVTVPTFDVFRDRSVFVTGHTGFKGSWLSLWLDSLGARVVGYSLPAPTNPSNFEVSRVHDLIHHHYEADVRNLDALSEAVDTTDPEVVFHLAAQPIVLESYKNPVETAAINILGTVHLLEAIRRRGRPCCVILVTSDKCYGQRDQPWGHREDEQLGGEDPYSASKAAAEILAASYRQSYFDPTDLQNHGVKLATVRAGNVIGGGDWAPHRIVPDIVKALESGEPVKVRNPAAIRPWQHVVEPLGGYLTLASEMLVATGGDLCTSWNFGPARHDEGSVGDVVEGFLQSWGNGSWTTSVDQSAPRESAVLRLATNRATARLGWRPLWSLSETVHRTARWYRRHADAPHQSMREECLTDITDYQNARKQKR